MTTTMNTSALAAELGLTDRRVRQLADEGVLRAFPDGTFDADEAGRAYRIYSRREPGELARLHADVEEWSAAFDIELRRLSRLPMARRLAAADRAGELAGCVIAALDLLAALRPAGPDREHHKSHVTFIQARLIGSLTATLGVQIDAGASA